MSSILCGTILQGRYEAFCLKLKRWLHLRHTIRYLVQKDLKGRYAGSIMGFFWTVVHPIITLLVFTFLFSIVLKVRFGPEGGTANFALYLFCGLLPWLAFQEAVVRSTTVIIDNANLVKKVVFPTKILPVYLVISSFITELIGLVILISAVVLMTGKLSFYIAFFPLLALLQLLFTLGVSWIFACINVFFRDIAHVVGVLLTIWMYSTPIVYPAEVVPSNFKMLITVNPMSHLVIAYRDIFLNGKPPEAIGLAILVVASAAIFAIGYKVFTEAAPSFPDLI